MLARKLGSAKRLTVPAHSERNELPRLADNVAVETCTMWAPTRAGPLAAAQFGVDPSTVQRISRPQEDDRLNRRPLCMWAVARCRRQRLL